MWFSGELNRYERFAKVDCKNRYGCFAVTKEAFRIALFSVGMEKLKFKEVDFTPKTSHYLVRILVQRHNLDFCSVGNRVLFSALCYILFL